jgi:hypothetical protein
VTRAVGWTSKPGIGLLVGTEVLLECGIGMLERGGQADLLERRRPGCASASTVRSADRCAMTVRRAADPARGGGPSGGVRGDEWISFAAAPSYRQPPIGALARR